MSRQFLRSICKLLVGVLLFAQMAVSAYACPGFATLVTGSTMAQAGNSSLLASDTAAPVAETPIADKAMTPCQEMAGTMDPSFANLCAEHCRQGQQSDHAATLAIPAVLLSTLYLLPAATEPPIAARPPAQTLSALAEAAAPLAILHCCFRI